MATLACNIIWNRSTVAGSCGGCVTHRDHHGVGLRDGSGSLEVRFDDSSVNHSLAELVSQTRKGCAGVEQEFLLFVLNVVVACVSEAVSLRDRRVDTITEGAVRLCEAVAPNGQCDGSRASLTMHG